MKNAFLSDNSLIFPKRKVENWKQSDLSSFHGYIMEIPMPTMKILQPYFLTLRKEKNSKKFGKYGLYVRQAIYVINAIILDAFSLVLNCKLALKW